MESTFTLKVFDSVFSRTSCKQCTNKAVQLSFVFAIVPVLSSSCERNIQIFYLNKVTGDSHAFSTCVQFCIQCQKVNVLVYMKSPVNMEERLTDFFVDDF